MTGTFEQEYEEIWQMCDVCHTLRPDVTYHAGKRACVKCQ
jgi:hypothetical protein